MAIIKSIYQIRGGFVVDLTSTTTGGEAVRIEPYELSRNNIRGDRVRSVKTENYGGAAGGALIISDTDRALFPPMRAGVLPLHIGNSGMTILAFWTSANTKKFVFYYDTRSPVIYDLVP